MSLNRFICSLGKSSPTDQRRVSTAVCLLLSAFCLLSSAGCRQDMQDQPKYTAYQSSGFFRDGLSSRQLVEGTVPRGYLRADREFYTGKKNKPGGAQGAGSAQASATPQQPGVSGPNPAGSTGANAQSAVYPDDVATFPISITMETVNRGQERYQIYCSACHGMTGYGDGLVVRRGFRNPPSFHEERLRQAPVGHFFDVSTNGWGAMPSYAAQIAPADRWAIIAYIRALQLSQERAAQPGTSPTPAPHGNSAGGKEHTK